MQTFSKIIGPEKERLRVKGGLYSGESFLGLRSRFLYDV